MSGWGLGWGQRDAHPDSGAGVPAGGPTPPTSIPPTRRPPLPRRNAKFPDRLVDTFPAPNDHIKTLHDILENSVDQYPDVRCSPRLCLRGGD